MQKYRFFWGLLLLPVTLTAHTPSDIALDNTPGDSTRKTPSDWHHLDSKEDNFPGISLSKAYSLLKGKTSQKVTVAVIDSGIDIEHEDLSDNIWVNEDEIPGNGIDDDKNGYVDDINGWNFIGGPEGSQIDHETMELTREYRKLHQKYKDKNSSTISGKEKKEYAYYKDLKEAYDAEVEEMEFMKSNYMQFQAAYQRSMEILSEDLDGKEPTRPVLEALDVQDEAKLQAKNFLLYMADNEVTQELLNELVEYANDHLEYGFNLDFDPRSIVGDDPTNAKERYYGNGSVEGPDAEHGTHVAGIIAAVRENETGVNGIADNVEIMVLRAVPDGDERDKDIANSIYYAVNNGAQIINMSFGKSYSPNKKVVDKAIKYAQKKGVLLIHASGNDGQDNDIANNFPTPSLKKSHGGKKVLNWIEVGASSWQDESSLAASFSNYGATTVDIFAPGVEIYSTIPDNKYKNNDGTSMAAPIVTGVASLLLSYYPQLDYKELKEILLSSGVDYKDQGVQKPGDPEAEVKFGSLSQTGKIINAYHAIKLAQDRYGN